ncbi:MAG: Uma2 family endonuclease [Polyangiaceae bacterium]|nr:Uma2 family endonuclease [Polyangiaceae bacterium]
MARLPRAEPGPFRVGDIAPGDRHELSRGNAIYCAPTGGTAARGTGYGFELLDSDPAVESAGVDAGFAPTEDTLRAPDVSVGVPDVPGWVKGAPPLAVEYAGTGQDEASLQSKIADLLEAGTRWVWVVRLVGPRCVEVHEAGKPLVVKTVGEELTAPGVLKNPVRAEALWDRKAAHEGTLRNLLQRAGYESVDAIRQEGRAEGMAKGLETGAARAVLAAFEAREWQVSAEVESRVLRCTDPVQLLDWLRRAIRVASIDEVFEKA